MVAVPGGGPGLTDTPMEISVRAKGKFTRARYFEMPAGFGGPGDLGGRYEWRYVTPSQNAFGHGRGYEEVRKTGCRDGECRPSPNADTDTGCKGKSKSKSESKNPFHSSTNHGAASKMVLERVSLPGLATLASATPLADSKPKLSSGPDSFAASSSSSSPLKIAEFIRCDEHGEEITSGWWGPAGQGGWLRIFEQDDALGEWMIVSTCLVMLKRERDRRTMQMSAAAGQGGGG